MTRAFLFGDNVDTDQIIPAKHMTTDDPSDLARYCLSGVNRSFGNQVEEGDVVVAGTNFGCGSSREHAATAIKTTGVDAVIAESFARIFFRNAINIGLPVFQVPDATHRISDGDEVIVDIEAGTVTNETTGETMSTDGFPPFIQELIDAGGLIEYGRQIEGQRTTGENTRDRTP